MTTRTATHPKQKKNAGIGVVRASLIALVIGAIARLFLLTPVYIEGESMMPTLADGDRLLVNNVSHRVSEPERQSIVVFNVPSGDRYIKRIVGIPGDTVIYKDKTLFVNGKSQEEGYLLKGKGATATDDFTLKGLTGSETIPEGFIFVLGDNRMTSTDSRTIGLVPIKDIVGTSNFVYWSDDREQIGPVEPIKR